MAIKPFLVAAMLAALAAPSFAQAPQGGPPPGPPPTNIRGTIAKVDGSMVTVKTRDQKTVMVMLAPNAAVRTLVRKKLSDIKPGDNLASTSVRGKDGKLHALEVHFLPAFVPESQTPYDLAPGSLMTNAHASSVAMAKTGDTLTLTLKGAPTIVVIDAKTKITQPADGAMADLKPGKAVFIRASKNADGSYSANNATVEKNGVKPPM